MNKRKIYHNKTSFLCRIIFAFIFLYFFNCERKYPSLYCTASTAVILYSLFDSRFKNLYVYLLGFYENMCVFEYLVVRPPIECIILFLGESFYLCLTVVGVLSKYFPFFVSFSRAVRGRLNDFLID